MNSMGVGQKFQISHVYVHHVKFTDANVWMNQ